MMSRIPYPERDRLSEAKRAYLDAPNLRLLNIARISMHAPDPIWRATVDLALAVVTNTLIDDRMREIIVLRVAYLSRSAYELFHHVSLARSIGIGDAAIAGLESGDFSALSPDEAIVAQFTTEVVRDVIPGDDTLAAMRARFSDERIFEMLGIIGSYMSAARVAAVAGIANDDVAITSWAKERETAEGE
jgi:alkylhydroperoxidase family enzyme